MTSGTTWPDPDAIQAAADEACRSSAGSDTYATIGPQTAGVLAAAGFPGSFVPERWGGASATFSTVTRAVAAVGEGCASAAWIASLWAYNGRFGAYLPLDGQEEVWAKGPDTRLVSSMVAAEVEAKPTKGGWTVSGSWRYVSGVEFADWALVSSALPREGDRSVLVFAIPRDSFTYENTWSTVGMRATGSHTLVANEVFVPEYRTFVWDDMRQGNLPGPTAPRYSAPLFSINGLTFSAPILGAARGALKLAESHLADRPSGPRAGSWASSQVAFGRAAGEVDAASLLLSRVAETADLGRAKEGLTERSHRDSTLAVELLTGAVDRLFGMTGTRGQASSHGMQRIWRDVHAAASHAAIQFEPAALSYTRGRLARLNPDQAPAVLG